jgi:hypothetical protein
LDSDIWDEYITYLNDLGNNNIEIPLRQYMITHNANIDDEKHETVSQQCTLYETSKIIVGVRKNNRKRRYNKSLLLKNKIDNFQNTSNNSNDFSTLDAESKTPLYLMDHRQQLLTSMNNISSLLQTSRIKMNKVLQLIDQCDNTSKQHSIQPIDEKIYAGKIEILQLVNKLSNKITLLQTNSSIKNQTEEIELLTSQHISKTIHDSNKTVDLSDYNTSTNHNLKQKLDKSERQCMVILDILRIAATLQHLMVF